MRTRRLVAGIVMVLFGTLAMLGHALALEVLPVEEPNGPQTPRKQLAFSGS